MDWSMNTLQALTSPLLRVPFVSEHVSSPHVLLHNMGLSSKNRIESAVSFILDYGKGQLLITSSWNRVHQVLSIFRTEDTIFKNTKIIFKSIRRLRSYIKHYLVNKALPKKEFVLVIKYLWKLIDIIYATKWDSLIFNKEKTLTIRKYVKEHIVPYYRQNQLSTLTLDMKMNTSSLLFSVEAASPSITNTSVTPPPFNKNVESIVKKAPKPLNIKKSYT